MTHDVFVKASDIYKKIEDFRNLKSLANKPYKRFQLLNKLLCASDYDQTEVVVCDKELTELIVDYCNKKIHELQEELDQL